MHNSIRICFIFQKTNSYYINPNILRTHTFICKTKYHVSGSDLVGSVVYGPKCNIFPNYTVANKVNNHIVCEINFKAILETRWPGFEK